MSLDLVIDAIKAERCLPFLGAGASATFEYEGRERPGIPLGGRLAELIAARCDYRNGTIHDLARVAEYYVFSRSGRRDELEGIISSEIARTNEPRPIHTVLAQLLEVKFIITSNYDTLLEAELHHYQRELIRHVYNLQNPKAGHFNANPFIKRPAVVLHKMHGSVDDPRSMVICRSDYIRYLANLHDPDRGMPEFFRKTIIPNFNLLFLGYSLEDWNFQVIWEGVLANYRDAGSQLESYALVRLPSDPKRAEFLRAFCSRRNINLIDCDLTAFALRLAREFNLEVPRLGIHRVASPGAGGVPP